ncbi:MAG: dTDP-4-dehydrorhamnose reductase [Acidimicrobiia bacterium]
MILVTGGSGQLGSAFRRLLPGASFPSRRQLDLTQPGTIGEAVAALAPTSIINCAAYTVVDEAEDDEEMAFAVNAVSVGVLARLAAERSLPFVTFSSDYVFDGRGDRPYVESDPTSPANAYGRSKEAGEQLALEAHPGALVVRSSWLISATHPNFVDTILRLAGEGAGELRVVDDQFGCPTIADDLAGAVLGAVDAETTGLLHLTNQGETTWFGLARAAVGFAGLNPERVVPVSSAEYPRRAARPAYSVLRSERLAGLGLDPLPPWEASLLPLVAGLQRLRSQRR